MASVRRWYIFLVCAVSLQAAAWGAINLLVDLATGQRSAVELSGFIAMIAIGLPVYLAHWLWAQALHRKELEERASQLRRLYLYGMLAGFLGPIFSQVYKLLDILGLQLFGLGNLSYAIGPGSQRDTLIRSLIALAVLGLLWLYHFSQVRADARTDPETGMLGAIRRAYVLGFSAAGLTVAIFGLTQLLRFALFQYTLPIVGLERNLTKLAAGLALLAAGLIFWVPFWRQVQRLFNGPSAEEKASSLRKLYLYAAVFIGVLGTVANAARILQSVIGQWMGEQPLSNLRPALAAMVGFGIVWLGHAITLRGDARQAADVSRKADIQRLYLYLVAGIGLAGFLIGLGVTLSVPLRLLLGETFSENLHRALSSGLGLAIVGLPAWLISWVRVQTLAGKEGVQAAEARNFLPRKIYLYAVLFAAAMTALGTAIDIVQRLVRPLLGGALPTPRDLGQVIPFTLIAVVVWITHSLTLRHDGAFLRRMETARLSSLRVVVVDTIESPFSAALTAELQRALPGLSLDTLIAQEPEDAEAEGLIRGCLEQAGLIIAPWTAAVPGLVTGPVFAAALASSAAHKLLLPQPHPGWDWAGVEQPETQALIQQAVQASRQIANGQPVRPQRGVSLASVFAIAFGVLLLLMVIYILGFNFFALGD